jgi:hypothetical protein
MGPRSNIYLMPRRAQKKGVRPIDRARGAVGYRPVLFRSSAAVLTSFFVNILVLTAGDNAER